MNAKEARKLSDEEIGIEVVRLRKRLFELRSQAVTEKIRDTSQFRKIKKDIARMLTVRNQRALEAAKAE